MPKIKDRGVLPPAVQLFCHRYIITGNKTKSIEEAFKTIRGKSAKVKACRLLDRADVKKYVASLQKDIHGTKEEVVDVAKNVLAELDLIGFSDIKDFFEDGTKESDYLKKIGRNTRAIESLEITDDLIGGVVQRKTMKIKLHSKIKGLEWRGKNLKLYTDMVEGTIITKPETYVPDNGRNRPANGSS
jgi:hypothetical protein